MHILTVYVIAYKKAILSKKYKGAHIALCSNWNKPGKNPNQSFQTCDLVWFLNNVLCERPDPGSFRQMLDQISVMK